MDVAGYVDRLGRAAVNAFRQIRTASTETRNSVLLIFAENLRNNAKPIKEANLRDVEEATKKGLSAALIDRLIIDDRRIEGMATGLEQVAALNDPVGTVFAKTTRPNGLHIERVRVPIGVIFMIYEARPNVTADAAGICLKAGNAVILRGGSEAVNSNVAIHQQLAAALKQTGLPEECAQVVDQIDRKIVDALLEDDSHLDLVIPRGGEGLIRHVAERSRVPVIKHYKGVCHVYVDANCDLDMAVGIAMNAKVQRPGVCNAMETLLVNENVAAKFLAKVGPLMTEAGVELRGCERTTAILQDAIPASEADWSEEYLDLILAVKIVPDIDAAIEHIAVYGSEHTDVIVTADKRAADKFLSMVDSSSVMVNASTRFSDGGEYGMGAEIGISTDRIHARGPMGLEELTTYKFVVHGDGQVRT